MTSQTSDFDPTCGLLPAEDFDYDCMVNGVPNLPDAPEAITLVAGALIRLEGKLYRIRVFDRERIALDPFTPEA